MQYKRDLIVQVAKDFDIEPNSHILGHCNHHENVVRNYARSQLRDPQRRASFIRELKRRHRGGRRGRPRRPS